MPRKKPQEPCEYCEGELVTIEAEESGELTLELYPGHIISASAILYNRNTEETYEATASVPMNYCPACGRKLDW
ncbi:MAG: hypothetical protein IKN04_08055 [Clostridia bacterium]|nr:hypothetical protein [Clostridia bacterium]